MDGTYNILLVDDDRIIRQMTKVYIEKLGYNVDIAENGQDALKMHAEKEYDLILMDVRMPVMDGLEATRKIRAIEKVKNPEKTVNIVAVTASVGKEKCLESGMNDYFNKTTLIDQMKRILSYVSTT